MGDCEDRDWPVGYSAVLEKDEDGRSSESEGARRSVL